MISPRERAARALCSMQRKSADAMVDGRPLWMSYLDRVDAVLKEALEDHQWMAMKDQDAPSASGPTSQNQGRAPDATG